MAAKGHGKEEGVKGREQRDGLESREKMECLRL